MASSMATSGGHSWMTISATGQKVRYSNKKNTYVDENGDSISPQVEERIKRALSSQAASSSQERPDANLPKAFERLQVGASGVRTFASRHPTEDVQTIWEISPPEHTSAQPFIKKKIRGYDDNNAGPPRDLRQGYGFSRNPTADFVRGRVIEMLLVPPPEGYGHTHLTPQTNHSQPPKRRFVIIKGSSNEDSGFQALPIKTYNGHGVANEIKSHHAIIYTKRRNEPVPQATPAEMPRRTASNVLEAPMQAQAIRVIPYMVTRPLDSMSRLHFFDVHEFDGNVHNIMLYGEVHPDSLAPLRYQYQAVWHRLRQHVDPDASGTRFQFSAASHPRDPAATRVSAPAPVPALAPGVLTLEQFRRLQAEIHALAHHKGIDPPALLNAQQEAHLAQDQEVRKTWRTLCLQIINATRQKSENSEDGEDDSSAEENSSDSDFDDH